jgi:hypothetical protein
LSRYIFLFFILPFLLWGLFGGFFCAPTTLVPALLITLSIAFICVTFEAGVWEDIARLEQVEGDANEGEQGRGERLPYELLDKLNSCDRVIFTGHSLGGAIATIAFAIYRTWCKSANTMREDNSVLITFGAPRVGDVKFMKEFSAKHNGKFCHVVHPGDPVPELPPNGLLELWHHRIWRRGLLGIIVVIIFPFWAVINKLYAMDRAARWTSVGQCIMDRSSRLSFSNHNMESYFEWVKKSENTNL